MTNLLATHCSIAQWINLPSRLWHWKYGWRIQRGSWWITNPNNKQDHWLVVSTHPKNMSQIGNLSPSFGVKSKKYLEAPPRSLMANPSKSSQIHLKSIGWSSQHLYYVHFLKLSPWNFGRAAKGFTSIPNNHRWLQAISLLVSGHPCINDPGPTCWDVSKNSGFSLQIIHFK